MAERFGAGAALHSASAVLSRPLVLRGPRRHSEPSVPILAPPRDPREKIPDLPAHLNPLLPWLSLTKEIDPDLTGVPPDQAFIFCPSLLEEDAAATIPVLPEATGPEDDLPFTEVLFAPPEPRPLKRYRHPALERKAKEEEKVAQCECRSRSPSEFVFAGKLPPPGPRRGRPNSEAVREKAMKELELLMQGIAAHDSSSPLVQFQADLNRMQSRLHAAFKKIAHLRQMLGHHAIPLSPPPPTPPPDHFGVRRFLREHQRTMSALERQYSDCVRELARLEAEADLQADGGHFQRAASQLDSTQ